MERIIKTEKQNLLECNNNRYPHIKSKSGWVKIPVLNTYKGHKDSNGCYHWTLIKTERLEKEVIGCE